MKQFKRLAAALLLGAMVLTMFTACCGTSKEERVLEAIKIFTGNEEIVMDADLQKDAKYVTTKFAAGENLESDREDSYVAYAKVSLEDEKFWDIMSRADDGDASSWTGPVWYKKSNPTVNAGLYLPYSDNVVSMLRNLKALEIEHCFYNKTKVGISVVNVKGDDYVVIVAGM